MTIKKTMSEVIGELEELAAQYPDIIKPSKKIYSHEDWRKHRTFQADVCQEVTAEIFDEMLCVLPPLYPNMQEVETAMELD
jgi:hypothetical protein